MVLWVFSCPFSLDGCYTHCSFNLVYLLLSFFFFFFFLEHTGGSSLNNLIELKTININPTDTTVLLLSDCTEVGSALDIIDFAFLKTSVVIT